MKYELSFPQAMNALLEGRKVRGKNWHDDSWVYLDEGGRLKHSGGFLLSALEANIPYEAVVERGQDVKSGK